MKKITLIVIYFLCFSAFAQKEHPTLTKMKAGYYLYLDNGLEQIDLFKKIEIKRDFFKAGTPKLIIAPKIGPTARKSAVATYTVLLPVSDVPLKENKTKNTFAINGSYFGKECSQAISKVAAGGVVTITEINLLTTDLDGPNLKGVRPSKPGQLPIGFVFYILD